MNDDLYNMVWWGCVILGVLVFLAVADGLTRTSGGSRSRPRSSGASRASSSYGGSTSSSGHTYTHTYIDTSGGGGCDSGGGGCSTD